MKNKIAFITGITGQDGSYLAELLLNKNYIVHGMIRRSSSFNTQRIEHLRYKNNFYLHYGDLSDACNINNLISTIKPTEVYNLGAQSHVQVSFEIPEYSANVDGLGTIRLLDAIRNYCPECKFYQASTSELFSGKIETCPQSELTPLEPRSPYAVAKLYSYWTVKNYREAYNLFAVNGILFNHESPRRGETFVTKKITTGLLELSNGRKEPIQLGNLNATRDWGYAKEYVQAMYNMMQINIPLDLVISTGLSISVKEFVEYACYYLKIKCEWKNEHTLINKNTGQILIEHDICDKIKRPIEVEHLCGDSTKAKNTIGWEPKINVYKLIEIMIDNNNGDYE